MTTTKPINTSVRPSITSGQRIVDVLGGEGHDTGDLEEALQDYSDISREDFDDAEEYSDERESKWMDFIDEVENHLNASCECEDEDESENEDESESESEGLSPATFDGLGELAASVMHDQESESEALPSKAQLDRLASEIATVLNADQNPERGPFVEGRELTASEKRDVAKRDRELAIAEALNQAIAIIRADPKLGAGSASVIDETYTDAELEEAIRGRYVRLGTNVNGYVETARIIARQYDEQVANAAA